MSWSVCLAPLAIWSVSLAGIGGQEALGRVHQDGGAAGAGRKEFHRVPRPRRKCGIVHLARVTQSAGRVRREGHLGSGRRLHHCERQVSDWIRPREAPTSSRCPGEAAPRAGTSTATTTSDMSEAHIARAGRPLGATGLAGSHKATALSGGCCRRCGRSLCLAADCSSGRRRALWSGGESAARLDVLGAWRSAAAPALQTWRWPAQWAAGVDCAPAGRVASCELRNAAERAQKPAGVRRESQLRRPVAVDVGNVAAAGRPLTTPTSNSKLQTPNSKLRTASSKLRPASSSFAARRAAREGPPEHFKQANKWPGGCKLKRRRRSKAKWPLGGERDVGWK